MKILRIFLAGGLLATPGCGGAKPVAVEIRDVCAQKPGTSVVLRGFISLPRELEITRYLRGGQGVTYKLFLTTKPDGSGDTVAAVFPGTGEAARNRVGMLPADYTRSDLVAFTDDGRELRAGQVVRITGETAADEKHRCRVDVSKIEQP
ncbi:MAG: hypothetical protein JSS81_15985 [Acidobacteria bacterium]|nr:hypothetical protein [Acidobacteriota bacterium]